MKKGITIIIVLAIIVVAGYLLFNKNSGQGTEKLTLDNELNPVTLTDEEKAALKEENINLPDKDNLTEKLKKVSSSDNLDSIEKDLNDTNFQDLDKEFADLEKLLGGL